MASHDYTDLSIWLNNRDTDNFDVELESFTMSTEGIFFNEDSVASNNISHNAGKQDFGRRYNQIHITESRETMRYIVKYVDNYKQGNEWVTEHTVEIDYYPMGANNLTVVFKEQEDNAGNNAEIV